MHFLEHVSSVSGKGRVEEKILVLVVGVKYIHTFTRLKIHHHISITTDLCNFCSHCYIRIYCIRAGY